MNGWEDLSRLSEYPLFHAPGALLAALSVFGLLIGALTGLFGVGGAFLLVPMLKLLFGIPYPVGVASSLSFTIGTGASGVLRHWRLRNFEPRSMALLAAGAVAGAAGGAQLNALLQRALGRGGLHDYTILMHGLFVVLLLTTAYLVLRQPPMERRGRSLLQRVHLGWRIDLPAAGLEGVSLVGLVVPGVLIGLLAGLLGIGGGVLFMPVLILVVGLTPHQAVGTSLGVLTFGAVAGTVVYGAKGDVNILIVMALLVGSTIGIQLGAAVCHRLHERHLKRWFAIIVLLAAGLVTADLVRMIVG